MRLPGATDLERLFRVLSEGGVRYVIVGGVAATIHGSARLTNDLDIVYERSDENIRRLVAALAPHEPYLRGAPPGLPFRWVSETLEAGLNFTLATRIGALDLLGEVAGGGTYADLEPHSIRVDAFGIESRCVDLPGLIRLKRAAGRPKDLEAVAELEALLEERSDR